MQENAFEMWSAKTAAILSMWDELMLWYDTDNQIL